MENTQVSSVNTVVENIKGLICNTPFDVNITINNEYLSSITDFAELYRDLLGHAFIGFTVKVIEGYVDLTIDNIDKAGNIILIDQRIGQPLILNKYWEEVYSAFGYVKDSLCLIISSIPEH